MTGYAASGGFLPSSPLRCAGLGPPDHIGDTDVLGHR
jgi:hypothetical protein